MTTDPAAQLLTLPPPALPVESLARLVHDHWGLAGTLTPLSSERDQNHRLDTPGASFTLKLSNPAEPLDLTLAQTAALTHLAQTAPDLPLPRLVPARDGCLVLSLPQGALRLFTWCPGTPLAHLPQTPALASAIGDALARLGAGLAALPPGAHDRPLLWDIRGFPALAPLMQALPPNLRPQAERFLQRFQTRIAPALARLPRQPIHGDFNPHNLLADPAQPGCLTGILDFGDMTHSPRACDLAVAASYLIDPKDPLSRLSPLVAAYHARLPLTGAELALLPDLVTARLWATLTITAWRAACYPDNAAYILRNAPVSRAGLAAFGATTAETLARQLADAGGRPLT